MKRFTRNKMDETDAFVLRKRFKWDKMECGWAAWRGDGRRGVEVAVGDDIGKRP